MRKIISLSTVALLLLGCVSHDMDDYRAENPANDAAQVNEFDFSTVNNVALTVDYSASKPSFPVFFRVFSEDPFKGDELDTSIKPIYSDFTDADGRFSQSVELPSYATDLYIFTGDFFVEDQLMNVKVTNNAAKAIADANANSHRAARRTLSEGSGVFTNSLETLYQLSYEVDYKTGAKLDNQIYNEWKTWLGKWDSRVKEDNENYAALTFTQDEMEGIHQSVATAVVRKEACPDEYRLSTDLELQEASVVAVTLVGSNTCWNNCLGYYYYQGAAPTNLKDIHVVMLFPNTQDGYSQFINQKHDGEYNGNIALERGDAVQLVYYPNIAQGSEEGATPIFPAGTKIGFLLKSNGWGMQHPDDGNKYYNKYKGLKNAPVARQYNCWSASTDGLSYCEPNWEQNKYDDGSMKNPNPERKARTAKFAYESEYGQVAIVAFEDAANDDDFGDVVLALKRVGVFQTLPVPTSQTTTTQGVYAYEDLWPLAGDYDMNDVVVEAKEDRVLTKFTQNNNKFLIKQRFNLTTYQNYVEKQSGLAVTLQTEKDYGPMTVDMYKIPAGSTEAEKVTYEKDGDVYLLTDNIKDKSEINSTYILELTYQSGIPTGKAAKIKPFIYQNVDADKRWEVHIPMEAPTAKMDMSFFGKYDDASDPANGLYYVRKGDYPFAFYLSGVSIDAFKNNILVRANEKKPINELFRDFLEWSQSKGAKKKDWYLHPNAE